MLLVKRCYSNYKRINVITKIHKPGDVLGVKGWIQNIRRLKNNIFLDINDGSTAQRFQIVVPKTDEVKEISTGSSILATGSIQVAPNGHFELHASEVKLLGEGHLIDGYPFAPKQKLPPEYVREHLHLRSRVGYIGSLLRLRHKAQKAIHDFMDDAGFVQINTPIVTTNDCEGAGEVFTVKPESNALLKEMSRPEVPLDDSYFDAKVYLSVSGQLHLEAACYGLGNTYNFAPAFRAENSRSPLHLAEFYMFEAELAFVNELSALTGFIEQMLKQITAQVLNSSATDLANCQKHALGNTFELSWLQNAWTTMSFKEAAEIILKNKSKFETVVNPHDGFSKEQEFYLVEHCQSPVFVVDWPAAQKPFYMKVSRSDSSLVHAIDLLVPSVGELLGGSLRESDMDRLRAHPQLPKGLEWYVDLRKFGGIPTAGFGMGFERYLQLLTGVKNIRDVIPFPRYPHNCRM